MAIEGRPFVCVLNSRRRSSSWPSNAAGCLLYVLVSSRQSFRLAMRVMFQRREVAIHLR